MQSIVAGPTDGARFRSMGDLVRILASATETGGAFEVFELEGPRGSGPPPHVHPWTEAFLVIDGEADVWVEGQKSVVGPGSFYLIPEGKKHGYRIRTESARFVVITSPGGARDFFVDLDAETGGSCEDMTKVAAIAVKHGFKV
jgi:quercetin dioxygenase-like cupin family protein